MSLKTGSLARRAVVAMTLLFIGVAGFPAAQAAGAPGNEAQQQQAAPQPTAQTPAEQPPPQPAQPEPPPLSPADQADITALTAPTTQLMSDVETLEKSVDRNRAVDDELDANRVLIETLLDGARQVRQSLNPRLEAIQSQIDKLGPPPAKDAPPESQQVANERARLNAIAAEINGAIKTTELAQVRGHQLYTEVQKLRQGLFASEVLKRNASPLSLTIWSQLSLDLSGATRQVGGMLAEWLSAAQSQWLALTGLIAAILLLYAGLKAAVHWLLARRLTADRDPPPTFFEQAATACWVAPLLALPAAAAITGTAVGLDALGLLTQEIDQISTVAVPALLIFVAVSALARAILSPTRPLWRLVDLGDRPARKLTSILSRIAAIYSGDLIMQEIIRKLYLPLSVSIMETALASIAIALLLLALAFTPFEPKPRAASQDPNLPPPAPGLPATGLPARPSRLYPALLKLPILALGLAILTLSLAGYIGLGRFLSSQVVVTGSAVAIVLIFHLAIRALLGGPGTGITPFEQLLERTSGLDSTQSGTLTRALALVLNASLALLAIPIILVTWGYSLPEALTWLKAAVFGFEVGQFRISFARILLAVLIFLGLLFATRIAQRWLDTGVLKSQRMDRGIANSIHTAVGYAGFLVAVLVAVSYGGLDITNFAIVAGALSVGIGFGLQSIVNNFVSGLILLVERPIKVGDWVAVKGQEGYVRRIAVRSTEIETSDRASLIVPNSDLITSTVTNWTHRNALGRVVIHVAVSYRSDPEEVCGILQKVASECQLILQHPPPGVGFDNFGPNGLEFSLSAVVPDVNKSGAAQTDLRIRILKAFRAAGIEIPLAQHDVHLRDLDTVRHLLTRLAEERAARTATPADKGSDTEN